MGKQRYYNRKMVSIFWILNFLEENYGKAVHAFTRSYGIQLT